MQYYQMLNVGISNNVITILKWRTAAILDFGKIAITSLRI